MTSKQATALLDDRLNDRTILDTLRRLDSPANRPASLFPIDISVMAYLVRRRAIDHEIVDSRQTLADAVGCQSLRTIDASLERLEKAGWISVRHRWNGNSNAIQVNVNTVPALAPVQRKVTKEAGQFAVWYKGELERSGFRKQVRRKNWLSRSELSAQRILNKCGGDVELAKVRFGWGLRFSKWQKIVQSGSLYHVNGIFDKMVKELQEYIDSKAKQTAIDTPGTSGGSGNEQ